MTEISNLFISLKKIIQLQGKTYADLALEMDLSEASVKRLFSQESMALERLASICAVLGMTMSDLFTFDQRNAVEQSTAYTEAQEEALAADDKLFVLLQLLLRGLTPAKIFEDYDFTDYELNGLLRQLDTLSLIQLHPNNHVRMRIRRHVGWNKNGPFWQKFAARMKEEFFASNFDGEAEGLEFFSARISKEILRVIERKTWALAREIQSLVELGEAEEVDPSRNMWFLLAYKPWNFSVITNMRRKPC